MSAPRPRLACSACTKRKVKCDKDIPCGNCRRRGNQDQCERDSLVDVPGSTGSSPVVSQSKSNEDTVRELRQRIVDLESAVHRQSTESSKSNPPSKEPRQRRADLESTVADQSNPGNLTAAVPVQETREISPTGEPESDNEDAATVLEFLTWGRMKDPHKTKTKSEDWFTTIDGHVNTSSWLFSDPSSEPNTTAILGQYQSPLLWLQLLLPDRRQLIQLVDYHSHYLLWFHGSYSAPTFRSQLDAFFEAHHGSIESRGVNLQFVALLFSVIAGTITSAPESETSQWGFLEDESQVLSQKWYKAAVTCLNFADFTAEHSIYSVQAIATLTNTAHLLGHSNSQSILLASAIRIAQNLGLHRLNADARGTDIDLETGRRVWTQLCTQDWFSTSFSEAYSINPLHSTSLPPKNCHDDMRLLPESTPTITSFCRYLVNVASIMPRLQDGMASANTPYTKYEKVLHFDKKMRYLATDGRPVFFSNQSEDENWPRYIPWARRAITISAAHKIIMIHRKFLNTSFTNAAFAFTHRTCIAAAKTILKEYISMARELDQGPTFWTHEAFSVAACIIICLELLHQPPGIGLADGPYSLVLETLEILSRNQKRNMIALRGVKVLKALQRQIDQSTTPVQDKQSSKRRADTGSNETSRKRPRPFEVGTFIRQFQGTTKASSNHHRANLQTSESNTHVGGSTTPRHNPLEGLLRQQDSENDDLYGAFGNQTNNMGNMASTDFDQFFEMPMMMGFDNSQAFENLLYLANNDM